MGVFHNLLGGAVCGFCHILRYNVGGTPADMLLGGGLTGGLLGGWPPQLALFTVCFKRTLESLKKEFDFA